VVTAREKRKKVKSGKTGCVHTPESADELDLVGLVAEVPATGANRQQGIDQQSNTDQQQQAVEQQAKKKTAKPTHHSFGILTTLIFALRAAWMERLAAWR